MINKEHIQFLVKKKSINYINNFIFISYYDLKLIIQIH